MYALYIFINSMFKSPVSRSAGLVLFLCSIVLPAASVDFRDTVPGTDQATDSMLILLSDPGFNRILDQAIRYQVRADSLRRLSIEWRKEAAGMDDPVPRGKLQKQIENIEDSMEVYKVLADEQFRNLAASVAGTARQGSPHPFLVRDTVLNGITVYHYRLTEEFLAILAEIRSPSTPAPHGKVPGYPPDKKPGKAMPGDAAAVEISPGEKAPRDKSPGDAAPGNEPPGGFRITDESLYSQERPFEHDFSLPPGVFYRIQIAVFSNEVAYDHFGGLSPITTESIPGRGMTRYFAGKFTRMENARSALIRVKSLGYPDAFIVGYYDGQKGSFSKLKALEKE